MSQKMVKKSRCIEATAGSGKTTLMVNELMELIIEQNVSPETCLAITFTEKAASEMNARLVSKLKNINYSNPLSIIKRINIETIHSFCNRLLKRHSLTINMSPHYDILSGLELKQRLEHHAATVWQGASKQPPDWLIECLSTWSLDQWTSMLINAYHNRDTIQYWFENGFYVLEKPLTENQNFEKLYHQKCQAFQTSFSEFLKVVDHDKLTSNWIDHDDILYKTYQLLTNVEWIRYELQDQLNHIFVDEFQDTSPIQWKIVNLLCGEKNPYESKKLVVVGDRCQAIYGFRGADDALMEMVINTKNPDLEHIKNNNNYRSHPAIIEFINELFSRLFADQNTQFLKMEPKKEANEPFSIKCKVCESKSNELLQIEGYIRSKTKYSLHEIAILVRKNYDAKIIKSHLESVNIPVQVSKGAGLCELDIIQVIICFIQGCLNNDDNLAWYAIAKDILEMDFNHINDMLKSEISIHQTLLTTNKKVKQWNDQLKSGDMLSEIIAMIWDLPLSLSAHDEMALNRFIHEFKAQWKCVNGNILSVLSWLDACIKTPKTLGVENESMDHAVQVMTLHAAKGLEFPVVIVPFLNAQFNMGATDPLIVSRAEGLGVSIPQAKENPIRSSIYNRQKRDAILEELRLFYVTLTRAKEHIFLTGQELKRKNSSRLSLITPYLINNESNTEFNFNYQKGNDAAFQESKTAVKEFQLFDSLVFNNMDEFHGLEPISVSTILDVMESETMVKLKEDLPINIQSSDAQIEGEKMHQKLANVIINRQTQPDKNDPIWLKMIIESRWYQDLIVKEGLKVEQPFEFKLKLFQIRGRFDLIWMDERLKEFQIYEFKRSLKGNLKRYHAQVNIYAEILAKQSGYQFNSSQSYLVDLQTADTVSIIPNRMNLTDVELKLKQAWPNASNHPN